MRRETLNGFRVVFAFVAGSFFLCSMDEDLETSFREWLLGGGIVFSIALVHSIYLRSTKS